MGDPYSSNLSGEGQSLDTTALQSSGGNLTLTKFSLTKQFGSLVSIAAVLAKNVYCVTSLALNRAVTCQQLIGDRTHM